MNKIMSLAGAAAMMAMVAGPVGAYMPTSNFASVTNYSEAGSVTGGNYQYNSASSALFGDADIEYSHNTMTTGMADSSGVGVVVANTNHSWMGSEINTAFVNNGVKSFSETGFNGQYNQASSNMVWPCDDTEVEYSSNTMRTGTADASGYGVSVANTNLGWGNSWNWAGVTNSTAVRATSGVNTQSNSAATNTSEAQIVGSSNTMTTGPATSTSHAWTVVNTNWSGFHSMPIN